MIVSQKCRHRSECLLTGISLQNEVEMKLRSTAKTGNRVFKDGQIGIYGLIVPLLYMRVLTSKIFETCFEQVEPFVKNFYIRFLTYTVLIWYTIFG